MKQLEIQFPKEESRTIFGGCRTIDTNNWILVDNAYTLSKRDKHILIFNTKSCILDTKGTNLSFISSDDETLKPSINGYLMLAQFLKSHGYKFNKKLSTIEEIPI